MQSECRQGSNPGYERLNKKFRHLWVVLIDGDVVDNADADGGGLGGIRLLPALLQLVEQLRGGVGTRAP